MPIRPSSAVDVNRLVEDLSSGEALRRETALARLAVIGARAVTRLSGLAMDGSAPEEARLAAIQALEAIGDPRSLGPALTLTERNDEIGVAAISVLGAIARLEGTRATRAFDHLTALVLDQDAPEERRLAGLAALDGLSERLLKPIYSALAADRSPGLRARGDTPGGRRHCSAREPARGGSARRSRGNRSGHSRRERVGQGHYLTPRR